MAKRQREARVGFERADAAFAEHDLLVAGVEDVFGRQQQLLDRGARAALEQYGSVGFADRFQQAIVLHVAGTDLQHVGVFGDDIDVLGGDDFRDDGQSRLGAGRGQKLQAFFLHSLETVGAGARLERTAAKGSGAGGLYGAGRAHDLLFALDGTRPGDDAQVPAADGQAAGADHRRLRLGFHAGQFVRGEHRQHFVDTRARFPECRLAPQRSSPMAAMTVRSVPRSTVGFKPSDSTCLIMCWISSSLAPRRMTTIMG